MPPPVNDGGGNYRGGNMSQRSRRKRTARRKAEAKSARKANKRDRVRLAFGLPSATDEVADQIIRWRSALGLPYCYGSKRRDHWFFVDMAEMVGRMKREFNGTHYSSPTGRLVSGPVYHRLPGNLHRYE